MKKNLVVCFVMLLLVIGYVKNIIGIFNCDYETPYRCEVVRLVGIIPPLGVFFGWVDVDDN